MNDIRPCRVADLPEVADLFCRVFRHQHSPPGASLSDYLEQLYFSHPWSDARCASLVYEAPGPHGRIGGFIGGLPMRFRWDQQRLLAAVAGTFMIDPALGNPLAGARLLRAFLGRGQDLSLSDTANEISRVMWETAGGATCLSQSLRWMRPLRPVELAIELTQHHRAVGVLRPALRYPAMLADKLGALCGSSLRPPAPEGYSDDLSLAELLEALPLVCQKRALRPDYDLPALRWQLSHAQQKQQYGPLHQRAVRNKAGKLVGWFLYYARAGGIARVLQIEAIPRAGDIVIDSLLHHAWQIGAAAVDVRVSPSGPPLLARRDGMVLHHDQHVVAHTDHAELIQALDRGNAFLSRLEGDWWTRLMGDDFATAAGHQPARAALGGLPGTALQSLAIPLSLPVMTPY